MRTQADPHHTDADWEYFGSTDPYWAVVTLDHYRAGALDDAGRTEFFASGEGHIAELFAQARETFGSFAPRRALDFGCGTGRLLLPLARRCREAVGVDVSESMLREAARNAEAAGLNNLSLIKGDDGLSGVRGTFDLVNTFIVLQHIPPVRGAAIFRRLVELLAPGGVGAIHLTYSTKSIDGRVDDPAHAAFPTPIPAPPPHKHFVRTALRRCVGDWLKWAGLAPKPKPPEAVPEPQGPPVMLMHQYQLNPIFHALQRAGVKRMSVELTDHGGEYGVAMLFRKP